MQALRDMQEQLNAAQNKVHGLTAAVKDAEDRANVKVQASQAEAAGAMCEVRNLRDLVIELVGFSARFIFAERIA